MMKNRLYVIVPIFALCCLLPINAEASPRKVITLTDGSILKGTVLGLSDGNYLLQTDNLGKVEISEEHVDSIQSEIAYRAEQQDLDKAAQTQTTSQATGTTSGQNPNMEQAINQVMADPTIMNDIQTLMQNEEIMTMLEDPELLNLLMNPDPKEFENNPKIQKLMSNPHMREVINSVQQKIQP
ncbi:MAG: hypothetical protein KC684_00405 [Candidatus Omnitrophica bacterium]|nr:hypothetical protein [Candidatus Omnitrophota bacterium]